MCRSYITTGGGSCDIVARIYCTKLQTYLVSSGRDPHKLIRTIVIVNTVVEGHALLKNIARHNLMTLNLICCGTIRAPMTVNLLPRSFLPRVSIACYAERCISHSKSVRPSVRLSVCHTLALSQNDSSYDHGVFTAG